MADTTSHDVIKRCGSLVRLASASDSPEDLVVAGAQALGRPLVLLDTTGARLVASPPSTRVDAPAAALTAAAAERGTAPPGWDVLPITHGGEPLAALAAPSGPREAESNDMLDLVHSLLGEQLVRAALANAVRGERRAALLRRLVTDESMAAADIRTEARAAGLALADLYWPALLAWTAGHPGPRTLTELHSRAERHAGTIAVTTGNTTVTLLIPAHGPDEPGPDRVHGELDGLVRHARHLGHPHVHAIADERSVDVSHVPARVSRLHRLQRYLPLTSGRTLVRSARSFALDCLLIDGLDRRRAEDFLRRRLCRLLRHDRDHGTDLAQVLELALDHPRRDDAAHAGFMHRNTFRRHLTQALELVDTDLNDPDERLTLHVALKLRRLLELSQRPAAGNRRGRDDAPPVPHGDRGSSR
jgi:sugar diacid utilization regulator